MAKGNGTRKVSSSPIKADKLHCSAKSSSPLQDNVFPADCPFPACRMETIELVEHAKQEWESTADSMPQLVCLLDESGHILRANRTVERWGLGKVAEVRGRKMHELLHPNCREANCNQRAFWETAFDLVEKGEPAEAQIEDIFLRRHLQLSFQVHQGNRDVNAESRGRFGVAVIGDISDLKEAEKKLQLLNRELELRVEARTFGLVSTNLLLKQEIEDRKSIEAELEKSREEFRRLVETMSEGLMACDKECLITYVNDRFCEMLGRDRKEVIGHTAVEFIDASSLPIWDQIRTDLKLKTGADTSSELKLKGKKGREIWAKISPTAILDQDGKISGSFAVVTDISDRIRAEQALRSSKQQLRLLSERVMSAQETERQRVAGELHDGIGQTLSAVKFCVESGIKRLYEQPFEDTVRQLESVIPRIQDAIEEVRRISMALRPSILDDIGILATLTWFCRESSVIYGNLRIRLQLDTEEECIPAQIKVVIFRIVQEAFNNTVKHSGADTVRISLNRTDDALELDFEDNGFGFDAKKSGNSGNKTSSGLGLISMRERAESSGGIYSITSSPQGGGTRIRVTWPLQALQCSL